MMWMLIMVIAMPQGLTSDIMPFTDAAACNFAQAEMAKEFKIFPLGKGGWVYMECLPTATERKKTPT
jgi:hypothetical protein